MLQEKIRSMEADASTTFPVGTRVRVKASVIVYHHPDHRSQPFDIKELEGEVSALVREWQGREVSANYPVLVKFSPKFSVHLLETELEPIA
jgi:hypothetical protein